jgi:cytochrome c oxidase subunit 2
MIAPDRVQSMLAPAGDQAAAIFGVWTLITWICGVVYVAILLWLAWVLATRVRATSTGQTRDPTLQKALIAFALLVVGLLTWMIVASFLADRRLHAGDDALSVRITAKQWWWRVDYLDPDPSKQFTTANELRLPRDRTVKIELRAGDVIHSFWVPNLSGKEDLIPGHANAILLTPRVAGRFRGQCAEFCGLQHAHMALDVQVETPGAFDQWKQRQLQPARTPMSPDARLGAAVFASTACASCHAIRGTDAGSRVGPDLTHLASRRTLAAGALPMDRGSLAAWIADPQHFKPGANMPAVPLSPSQSAGVVEYLMELK